MTSTSENTTKKTYVIGITGSIGCGKSLVGRQLQDMGVAVIDADHLSHELVNKPGPAYDKILARFGTDLAISPGGPIDRKKLGAIVFNDTAARTDLEAILHPAIGELQKTRTIELAKTHDIVAVLVPLLFETGSQGKYSSVWAVIVHKEIQIQRLKLRDKLTDEEVVRRIKAQWPQDKKAELADKIVDNSGSPEQTLEQVKSLVADIRAKMGLPQTPAPTDTTVPAPTDTSAPSPTDSTAPAPTDSSAPAPTDTSAPSPTDSTTPAPTDSSGPAPAVPTEAETTNLRNRAALKQLGEIAAEEALEKLGDIGTTAGREATASMTMAVKAGAGAASDKGGPTDVDQTKVDPANGKAATGAAAAPAEAERELQVDVRMSVRNRPGTSDPTPVPVPVPVPAPTPTDPKPQPEKGDKNHSLPIVACLLAFMAFLAFLLVWSYNDTPVVVKETGTGGTTKVVVVVNPSHCCDTTTPPVVLPLDPTVKPPVVVTSPPTPVDPPVGNCKVGVEALSEPPAFILGNLHNQVRWRVVKWTVITDGVALNGNSCLHTTVEGRNAEGLLVVRQFYGEQLAYKGQFTINYNADCTTQVDRFNEHNMFIGRTVYLSNSDGKMVGAIQYDEHQRKLFSVNVERSKDGSLYAVSYSSYAASGQTNSGYFEKISLYREFLSANFYLSELVPN